jgi:hypothetical protein
MSDMGPVCERRAILSNGKFKNPVRAAEDKSSGSHLTASGGGFNFSA